MGKRHGSIPVHAKETRYRLKLRGLENSGREVKMLLLEFWEAQLIKEG